MKASEEVEIIKQDGTMNKIICILAFVVLLVSSVGVAGCAKEADTGAEVNI